MPRPEMTDWSAPPEKPETPKQRRARLDARERFRRLNARQQRFRLQLFWTKYFAARDSGELERLRRGGDREARASRAEWRLRRQRALFDGNGD